MSDSESSKDSSDNEDLDKREELDANDVKLQQMRRGAQKRGGQSKIVARFEGLVSYDDMLRQHAFQRMKDGIQKILSLHTPVELSSLCGCLGLKVQEKAATSIHFITQYASESSNLDEARLRHIMNFMWEGALWEYLHFIGHPVHSMRPDPKKTILEIWEKGGLLGNNVNGFTPHFIAREVKKRNEWVQSEDIQARLEKLRVAQDAAKSAERKVVSEHDYTNILTYFNQMSALRRQEHSMREYLMQEVEILRSRIDSCAEVSKVSREQLAENELYYMKVVNEINAQLALTEFVCEERIAERYQLEGDLQRLGNVVESYLTAEENRQQIGGGTVQALKLREVDKCAPTVRAIHAQLQKYKQVRDHMDSTLRAQSRGQRDEVERLNELVDALQEELEGLNDFRVRETTRADRAERELFFCRRKLARTENKHQLNAQEAWASSTRFANALRHIQLQIRSLRPALMAALAHPHRTVISLGKSVLTTLALSSAEEISAAYENACMKRADLHAHAMRRAELARIAAMSSPAAVAARTKSKVAKGGKVKISASSKSKKSTGGGDNSSKAGTVTSGRSRASTPSEASRPNSRANTPKAGAAAKSPANSSTKKKPSAKKK